MKKKYPQQHQPVRKNQPRFPLKLQQRRFFLSTLMASLCMPCLPAFLRERKRRLFFHRWLPRDESSLELQRGKREKEKTVEEKEEKEEIAQGINCLQEKFMPGDRKTYNDQSFLVYAIIPEKSG